jgi:hypothetical protein
MIHYKSEGHPRYPNTGCGKSGTSCNTSSEIKEVDCKMCINSYNKFIRGIDPKKLKRNYEAKR